MGMTEILPDQGLKLAELDRKSLRAPRDPSAPPSTLDAPMNPRRDEQEVRLHETMVPRTLTVAGFFILFAFPAVALLLNDGKHLTYRHRVVHMDDKAHRIILVLLVGAAGCLLVGWLWWSVAAALNARKRSRWAVSPFFVPVTYVLYAMLALIAGLSKEVLGDNWFYGEAGALAVAVIIYFSTLGAYSKTAQGVGSPSTYFTRLIVIPWAAFAGSLVALFFARYLSEEARLIVFLLFVLVQGVYGLTMFQAMSHFDRACAGTRMAHDDPDAVANFLKFAR
jgi:biotin transporter BioY